MTHRSLRLSLSLLLLLPAGLAQAQCLTAQAAVALDDQAVYPDSETVLQVLANDIGATDIDSIRSLDGGLVVTAAGGVLPLPGGEARIRADRKAILFTPAGKSRRAQFLYTASNGAPNTEDEATVLLEGSIHGARERAVKIRAAADIEPNEFTFSADVDGTALRSEWDFGDGTSASGAEVRHVYDRRGTFLVTVKVADGQGTRAITVSNVPPSADFDFDCDGTRCHFAGRGSDDTGVSRYEYDFGDGSTAQTAETTHEFAVERGQLKAYAVRMWAVDDDGARSQVVERTVSVAGSEGRGPLAFYEAAPCRFAVTPESTLLDAAAQCAIPSDAVALATAQQDIISIEDGRFPAGAAFIEVRGYFAPPAAVALPNGPFFYAPDAEEKVAGHYIRARGDAYYAITPCRAADGQIRGNCGVPRAAHAAAVIVTADDSPPVAMLLPLDTEVPPGTVDVVGYFAK